MRFIRGQFWPMGIVVACVCLWVCPCELPCVNPNLVRAKTPHLFKLEPLNSEKNMQTTLIKIPINLKVDWPWSSMWNLAQLSKFHNARFVHKSSYTATRVYRISHFADDIFKCVFLKENAWISLQISLKIVPKVSINNIAAMVQIMACLRPGSKTLSALYMH